MVHSCVGEETNKRRDLPDIETKERFHLKYHWPHKKGLLFS